MRKKIPRTISRDEDNDRDDRARIRRWSRIFSVHYFMIQASLNECKKNTSIIQAERNIFKKFIGCAVVWVLSLYVCHSIGCMFVNTHIHAYCVRMYVCVCECLYAYFFSSSRTCNMHMWMSVSICVCWGVFYWHHYCLLLCSLFVCMVCRIFVSVLAFLLMAHHRLTSKHSFHTVNTFRLRVCVSMCVLHARQHLFVSAMCLCMYRLCGVTHFESLIIAVAQLCAH